MDNVTKDTLLKAIFLQHARLPFRLTQLEANLEMGICGGELRAAVPFLLRQEKLEAIKNKSGEVLLRINENSLPLLANELIAENFIPYDPFEFVIEMECGEGLIYTILHWLAWIYYNGLPLTSKGSLFRKTIQALQGLTPFEDEQLKGLQLQLTVQHDLPISIAFMLDILVNLSVLQLDSGEWKIQNDRLQMLLNLDLSSVNKQLLNILCQNYVPARKYQQQVVALLTCTSVQQGEVYVLDKVLSKLQHTSSIANVVNEEQQLWLNSWLYVLGQCGWLERGKLRQNSSVVVFRWREDQFQSKHEANLVDKFIIVQPDFEMLVPPYVDLATRYELELMTECVHIDVMSQYRLTKRKFCLALQSGLSWELPSELPVHIGRAIAEWTREVNLQQAHQNIQQHNIPLRKGISKSIMKSGITNDIRFVQPTSQLPSYEVGVIEPDFACIFPDIDSVPLKWRQQLSSYHPSTLRYLIEQAITWKIKIELQLEEQYVYMIPTVICDELDGWHVVGVITSHSLGEPVLQSIPYKQCYAAKLLVPNIDATM